MPIKLDFKGFDDYLEKLIKAEKNVDEVVEQCIQTSAGIIQSEYVAAMSNAKVDSGLIGRMDPYTIEHNGNTFSAHIGYKKGPYNPKDPSDGYKAIFLNYGTPRIHPRDFIKKMKKSSLPKVKKEEKKILENALGELK